MYSNSAALASRRGKTIRVQIGRHGALPFEDAKARAHKIIADIDDGRNPNREKEAERLSPTVAQLAERFLEGYVPAHCKPRTRVEYVHAVKRYILPALGEIRVVALCGTMSRRCTTACATSPTRPTARWT